MNRDAIFRYVVIAGAIGVVARAAVHVVDNTATSGMLLMGALATVGTQLGRLPQARHFARLTGVFASCEAVLLTAGGAKVDGWPFTIAYLVAGVSLLAAAQLMKPAAAEQQPSA